MATELWNSSQNSARDSFGGKAGHWQIPTIVNGKAYIPTGSASIVCYGLLGAGPHIGSVTALTSMQVNITFDKPLDTASANTAANYTVSNGVTVASASQAADSLTVNLTTSSMAPETYTLTVNNVKSSSSYPNTPKSMASFTVSGQPNTLAFTSVAGLPNPGTVNYAVDFDASTNASDAVITWDFGDGSAAISGASVSAYFHDRGNLLSFRFSAERQSQFNGAFSQTISVQILSGNTLPGTQNITTVRGSLRFAPTKDQIIFNATLPAMDASVSSVFTSIDVK